MNLRGIADVIRSAGIDGDKSEVAIAKVFLRHLGVFGQMDGNHVRPVCTRGTIYLYDAALGIWEELKQQDALALIQCYDGAIYGRDLNKKIELGPVKCKNIHQAATLDLDHRDQGFFDNVKPGVAFANGFVTTDANGPTLSPKSPENKATYCLPFDFSPEAECSEWIQVLRRVFDGSPSQEDDGKLLQEFIGACLTGNAWRYCRALILSGGGNNGKSVVAEFITEQLFPASSVSYTSPQSWAKPEYLSRLRDAQLNVANEIPADDIQAGDVFKAVIDGGAVTARNLYENPYTLKSRAGHIFLANDLPGNRDNSNGFWRRMLVLPFRRDFSRRPDDTGKLRTKEEVKTALGSELPGVSLWALHGASRLLRQGGYTQPVSHRLAIAEWRRDVDQVAAFLNECCTIDGGYSSHDSIYRSFREWCERSGRQAVGNRKLATRLRSLGVDERRSNGLQFTLTVMSPTDWGIGKGVETDA